MFFFCTEFSKSKTTPPPEAPPQPPATVPGTGTVPYVQRAIAPDENGITRNHVGEVVLQQGRRMERLANFFNPTDYNAQERIRSLSQNP